MPAKKNTKEVFLKSAKSLIRERGWRGLAISDIAKSGGLSVGDAYAIAATRAALLGCFSSAVDAELVTVISESQLEENPRDRLFDALMSLFDIMGPDKDLWRIIYFDDRADPLTWRGASRRTTRTMARLLEAIELGGDGGQIELRLRAAALSALFWRILPVWLGDAEDQAKTMTALDKSLRRLERLFKRKSKAEEPGDADSEGEPKPQPTQDTVH